MQKVHLEKLIGQTGLAREEIYCIFWNNPKIHYCALVNKALVLSHMTAVHIPVA